MIQWKTLTQRERTRFMVRAAIVAALYAALTLMLAPMSFGPVQFRASEALTLLPIVMPEAIPGLFIGCLLANLLGSATVWDIVFGSLATLIAAACTYATRRNRIVAAAWPVVFNGLIVGSVLAFAAELPLWITIGEVALGELAVVCTLGTAMLVVLDRMPAKYLGTAAR